MKAKEERKATELDGEIFNSTFYRSRTGRQAKRRFYIYLEIIMHFLNETLARWRPDKGAEIRRKEL